MEDQNSDCTQYSQEQQPSGNVHHIAEYGNGQSVLPYSIAVLVMGIMSIPLCFFYGNGLILGIIALVMASKGKQLYFENTSMYLQSTYNMLKSGHICALIGTILSAVYLVFIVIYIIVLFTIGFHHHIHSRFEDIFDKFD